MLPVVITRSLTKQDAGLFFQATAVFTILLNVGTDRRRHRRPARRCLGRSCSTGAVTCARYLVLAIVPAVVFSVVLAGLLVLAVRAG